MRSTETVRTKVRFPSGDTECVAWHYPGTNGACVIMAGGFGVTKEPGTDRFAARFHQAGFSVLAFDYRHLGESGGRPRQVLRVAEQLADWDAAIAYAKTLPEAAPNRLIAWGFSATGGYLFQVAARHSELAGAIAQTPTADGAAATRNAARFQSPLALLKTTGLSLLDTVCGWFGRSPILVPLAGPPGSVAMLTMPDALRGQEALQADRYPEWVQAVAARSLIGLSRYRPGRDAARIGCPLLVVVAESDQAALVEPSVRAAQRAPRGRLLRIPGGHYEPFLGSHETVVDAELAFLREVSGVSGEAA